MTIDQVLVTSLKLNSKTTWSDIKEGLKTLVKKSDLEGEIMKILQKPMREDQDIVRYRADIRRKYAELQELYGDEQWSITEEEMVASTVTENLVPFLRKTYRRALERDPDRAMVKLEAALRNPRFRKDMFNKPVRVSSQPNLGTRSRRCRYHDKGKCKYGAKCRFGHLG